MSGEQIRLSSHDSIKGESTAPISLISDSISWICPGGFIRRKSGRFVEERELR